MSARVIRAPNHLGDVVAALPAILEDGSDVMVVRWLAPVLEMSGVRGDVLPLDRGPGGFVRAARELRRRRYDEGVLLSAAFSAAWLFRWGGVPRLRGTATDGRSPLLSERVQPRELRPYHRIDAYRLLLGQQPTGSPVSSRVEPPAEVVTRWRERVGGGEGALVGVIPGAHAPARRWPAERFGRVVARLASGGARVIVLGGAAEVDRSARVASAAQGARDFAGRTDLADLAALISLCDLVVTNDTGPMHLAGAVGTPTVSLWGPSDPGEVRQLGSHDLRVSGPELPCKPCYRNRCPRRGRGTRLADAHEECMRLIEVDDVLGAAEAALARGRFGEDRR